MRARIWCRSVRVFGARSMSADRQFGALVDEAAVGVGVAKPHADYTRAASGSPRRAPVAINPTEKTRAATTKAIAAAS